jgi:hypothetical protein
MIVTRTKVARTSQAAKVARITTWAIYIAVALRDYVLCVVSLFVSLFCRIGAIPFELTVIGNDSPSLNGFAFYSSHPTPHTLLLVPFLPLARRVRSGRVDPSPGAGVVLGNRITRRGVGMCLR